MAAEIPREARGFQARRVDWSVQPGLEAEKQGEA